MSSEKDRVKCMLIRKEEHMNPKWGTVVRFDGKESGE